MLSSATTKNTSPETHLDRVFHALGDRTRRKLLSRLAEGPARVTELAKPFDMSLAAVGKHLRVLEKAGLVQRTIRGRVHQCSLNALPLRDAEQWLVHYQAFWEGTLDGLIEYLQNESDQDKRA